MTRSRTRPSLHSSTLVRVLADLSLLEGVESGSAFAEKMGVWLNLNHAITLHAALNVAAASAVSGHHSACPDERAALTDRFNRLREALMQGIRATNLTDASGGTLALPAPNLEIPADLSSGYEPYRRYYLAHQREMLSGVGPLRIKARQMLARASPGLRTLATLDGALEEVLSERESRLLAKVPKLLEKRFKQLFSAHQQRLESTGLADCPEHWMRAGGWLALFRSDLQTALLAELELRLQPTVGLIEALENETSKPL